MGGLSHTVSGDIASFRTPSRVPIESLKFHFLPKQAAGTPSPENPIPIEGWTGLNGYGAGFNVLPFDSVISEGYTRTLDGLTVTCLNGIAHITGDHNKSTWTNIIDFYSVWSSNPIVLPPGTYTASNGLTVVCKVDDADSYVNYGYTFTVEKQALVRGFYAAIMGEVTVDKYIPLVLTVGAERPKTYLPYKPIINIPITFPTGKNLLNTMDVNNLLVFDTVSPGRIDTVNVGTRNSNYVRFNQVFHAGTYTISGKISGPGVKAIRLLCSSQIASSIWNQYYNAYFIDVLVGGKWTFTVNEDFTIGVVFVIADGHGTEPGSIYDLQLEYGSEATDFEPWSPISAFYGGYIDPVAGEIVAEYKKHVYDGTTMRVSMNYKVSGKFYGIKSVSDCQFGSSGHVISNMLKTQTNHGENTCTQRPSYPGYLIDFALSSFCDLSTEAYDTLTIQEQTNLVNDYLAELYENETPLVIVYKLSSPVHIPIPAEDLQAFLDRNNFWSDANDITEVTYAVTESKDILATRKKAMDFDMGHRRKVRWNQLARDISTSHWRMYSSNALRGTISDGIAECYYVTNKQYQMYSASVTTINSISWDADHYYYASYMVKPTYDGKFGIEFARGKQIQGMASVNANEWKRAHTKQKSQSTGFSGLYIPFPDPVGPIDEGYQVKAPFVVDLTLMFGAGNEPQTVAEFERICALNGIDLTTYQPYDEGSDRWLIVP